MKKFLLISLLLFSFSLAAQTVTRVIDGDTFIVDSTTTVRVAEIDAPELNQSFGIHAKNTVKRWLLGKEVELVVVGTDRYGRTIAKVCFDGFDLAEQLVLNGLAWEYKKYSKGEVLGMLEELARKRKINIWSGDAVAPWKYRRK